MTRYNQDDLEANWEFKIIRSHSPVFRRTAFLKQVLEEESLAGWQMLEKLDDTRIRLKRPVSAQRRDAMLPRGVDPYRSQVGGAPMLIVGTVLGLTMALVLGALVFLLSFRGSESAPGYSYVILGSVVLVGVLAVAAAAIKNRV